MRVVMINCQEVIIFIVGLISIVNQLLNFSFLGLLCLVSRFYLYDLSSIRLELCIGFLETKGCLYVA